MSVCIINFIRSVLVLTLSLSLVLMVLQGLVNITDATVIEPGSGPKVRIFGPSFLL